MVDEPRPGFREHVYTCAECGAELEPNFAAAEGHDLVLSCRKHWPQGLINLHNL